MSKNGTKMLNAILVLALVAAGYLSVAILVYSVRNPELTQMQVLLDAGKAATWQP